MKKILMIINKIRQSGEGWDDLRDALIPVVRHRLGNRPGHFDEVEDVVQDCLVRILKDIHKIGLDDAWKSPTFVSKIINSAKNDYLEYKIKRSEIKVKPASDTSYEWRKCFNICRAAGLKMIRKDFHFNALDYGWLVSDTEVDQIVFQAIMEGDKLAKTAREHGFSPGYLHNRSTIVRRKLLECPSDVKFELESKSFEWVET